MRLITDNYILTATLTPSTVSPLFPLENLQNILRSKRFRTTSKATQNIVIDLSTAKDVDSFVMLLPKEGTINLTASAVIKLQANATDVWTSPSVDQTLTFDGVSRQLSYYFGSTQNYRYWRLTIDDASAVGDYVEISKLILGEAVTIPLPQNGFKLGKTNNTKLSKNDFGSVYADKYPVLKKLSLEYKTLLISEIEQLESVYDTNGNHTPVFMTLDYLSTLFDKDEYSIYGLLDEKFDKNHINYNILDSSGFEITELN